MKRHTDVLKDWLVYHPAVRETASMMLRMRGGLTPGEKTFDRCKKITHLASAARLSYPQRMHRDIESTIARLGATLSKEAFPWDAFYPGSKEPLVRRSLILKTPGPSEKGVLFVAFEDDWLRLLRYAQLEKLSADYRLIIAPTWWPPYELAFLLAAAIWPGELYTTSSNYNDMDIFQRLSPKLTPIPLLASSWVNAEYFSPDPAVRKEYDIAMLAVFAPYKRHAHFFRVLRKMPPAIRVLVVGTQIAGYTREALEDLAVHNGVRNRITFRESPTGAEILDAFRRSRISAIFSKREGSCVAIMESLLCNTPAAVLEGALLGSAAHISAHTGALLKPGKEAEGLLELIERSGSMNPREFCISNGWDHRGSSRMLNNFLRDNRRPNEVWTRDITEMQWRPNPCYLNEETRLAMRPFYQAFSETYGVPLYETTWP